MATDSIEVNTLTSEIPKGRLTRQSAEISNFFRFVYENDLRREAGLILSAIVDRQKKKLKKKRRKKAKSKAKVKKAILQ